MKLIVAVCLILRLSSFKVPHDYRSRLISILNSKTSASAWIESKEVSSPDNRIKINDNRICVAKTEIKKNDLLFNLPRGLCLDVEKAERLLSSVMGSTTLRTGDLGYLALLLLHEKSLGSKSKFASYIDSLPTETLGALGWSSDNLQQFISSTTRNIQSQLNAIKTDITTILESTSIRGLFTTSPSYLTEENLRWAIGIVKAKSVYIDGSPVLVPGIDYIHYDPLSDNEPVQVNAGMFGGKSIKVKSDRDYKIGDKVYMSYGLKSSAECVEDHGFCPIISPVEDSCCELSVEIESTDRFADDKIDILERNGYRKSARFDIEARDDIEIDPELIRFLRLKLIDGKDSFILESCFANTVFDTMSYPFSKPNEIKIYEYILNICQSLLSRINTISNQEQDDKLIQNYTGNTGKSLEDLMNEYEIQTPELALSLLRTQERAVLVNTVNKVNNELLLLQGMDLREYYQERRLSELNLLRPLDDSEIRSADDLDSDSSSSRYNPNDMY